VVKLVEKAKELLAEGFDCITETESVKLFRRAKRFNGWTQKFLYSER
jgi:hypothetical protein